MSYKISKELFEAVMSLKVIEFYCRNEIQYYPADKERVRCIDWIPTLSSCEYNDFFFKCKEWALKQEICLLTGVEEHMPISYVFVCFQSNRYRPDPQSRLKNPLVEHKVQTPTIYGNNEKQCLFDACQWILDNKDKQ